MNKPRAIALFFILLILGICNGAVLTDSLRKDSYIKGQLDNGLTYYIHEISDNKVSFYLIEKAGSINEEDSQSGLAHFIEHMAFKGTRNFPGRNIIDYLQSKNVRFGSDLNAVTSFDKTIFRIENVPAESGLIDSCLLILKDWSNDLILNPEDIDAERKVIIQEGIATASSKKKVRQQFADQLLDENNPFRTKTPIGNLSNIKEFPYEELIKFYKRWYNPALQAIIIEGNIDSEIIEKKIKTLWKDNNLKLADESQAENFYYEISDKPQVAIAIDNELKFNNIDIQFLRPPTIIPLEERDYYIENLKKEIIASIFSYRLRERAWKGDSIVKGGAAYNNNFTVSTVIPSFTVGLSFSGNNWGKALDTLVYESKRLYEYGVTEGELKREKEGLNNKLKNLHSHSDLNERLVNSFIDNFTKETPIIPNKRASEYLSNFLDTVSTDGFNPIIKELIHETGDKSVVLLRSTGKEDPIPSRQELAEALLKGWQQTLQPYVYFPINPKEERELAIKLADKGEIKGSEWISQVGVQKYILSNGAKVYFIKALENEDNVSIIATGKGGYSFYPNEDKPYKIILNDVIKSIGIGNLSSEELKILTQNKGITWNISLLQDQKRFTANATKENIELLFQLLYGSFSSPNLDVETYENWLSGYKNYFKIQNENPYMILNDSIKEMLYGKDYSDSMRLIPEDLEKLSRERIIGLYKESFSDASDFDFIIAGNLNDKEIKNLLETYIGSLPSFNKASSDHELSITPLPSPIKHIYNFKSPEPNSTYFITRTLMVPLSCNNLKERLTFNMIIELLRDSYLKEIRDKSGSVYNIDVFGDISKSPKNLLTLNIYFKTTDKDFNGLINNITKGIENLSRGIIDNNLLNGIKSGLAKEFETYSMTDDFKINRLQEYLLNGSLETDNYLEILDAINATDLKELSKTILEAPTDISIIME